MSTRKRIEDLVKSLGNADMPFSGLEEEIILDAICGKRAECVEKLNRLENVNRLTKAAFALPRLHEILRNESLCQYLLPLRSASKNAYLFTLAENEYRIAHLSKLARWFADEKIEVLLLKGAAELALFSDKQDYLALRGMGDIDILCRAGDQSRIDELLEREGYRLYDFEENQLSRKEVIEFSLREHGHLVYEAYTRNHLEVHFNLDQGENAGSYPLEFVHSLMDTAYTVEAGSCAGMKVPSPNNMLAYSIFHAAGAKEHDKMLFMTDFALDAFTRSEELNITPWCELLSKRLDSYQLLFLHRFEILLRHLLPRVDIKQVTACLSATRNSSLIDMYLDLIDFCFDTPFASRPSQTRDFARKRRDYLLAQSVPSVAMQIELILEDNLEQRVKERMALMEDRMRQREDHSRAVDERWKELENQNVQMQSACAALEEDIAKLRFSLQSANEMNGEIARLRGSLSRWVKRIAGKQ